ncbi:MAG: hypothetical protein KJ069_10055 [Anaerolineae bacterium]|nr:hypothetical protein [Anaerolineae bacterium]
MNLNGRTPSGTAVLSINFSSHGTRRTNKDFLHNFHTGTAGIIFPFHFTARLHAVDSRSWRVCFGTGGDNQTVGGGMGGHKLFT